MSHKTFILAMALRLISHDLLKQKTNIVELQVIAYAKQHNLNPLELGVEIYNQSVILKEQLLEEETRGDN